MNNKSRLDSELTFRRLVRTRSQAAQEIEFGNVAVNGKIITKTAFLVSGADKIRVIKQNPYVSRAGLKLASVAADLKLDFKDKIVLDVGSSTGGFTDYSLQHGATKVIAVDVGTNQLHPKLRTNRKVELYEQTDIREIRLRDKADIAVIDVSFISLRKILPAVGELVVANGKIVAMCKPQFEAEQKDINRGVVKNSTVRRKILKNFEMWLQENNFIINGKSDSDVAGEKGNVERFYLLALGKIPPKY